MVPDGLRRTLGSEGLGDRLIPSPIRRVLSLTRKHRVRALLMGGQACVLYGAAGLAIRILHPDGADDKRKLRRKAESLFRDAVQPLLSSQEKFVARNRRGSAELILQPILRQRLEGLPVL